LAAYSCRLRIGGGANWIVFEFLGYLLSGSVSLYLLIRRRFESRAKSPRDKVLHAHKTRFRKQQQDGDF
jgi:hypothetical protein